MRYRHWLSDFMTNGPAALQKIRESFTNGSREDTIRLAHALKGRTGMLGMSELHSICLSLEQALKEKEPRAFWVDELDQAIHAMCREIDDALSGPRADEDTLQCRTFTIHHSPSTEPKPDVTGGGE